MSYYKLKKNILYLKFLPPDKENLPGEDVSYVVKKKKGKIQNIIAMNAK